MQDISLRAMKELPGVVIGNLWSNHLDFPDYMFGVDGTVISVVKKPRVLKPVKRGRYQGFTLKDAAGDLRPVYLHRVIAEAYHGPCPPGMECRHLDGDKTKNSAGNLEWGTHAENIQDCVRHGTTAKGERNPQAKLTEETVMALRDMRAATGQSYKLIAQAFGVSTMTAYRAVVRQSWK